MRKKQPIDDVRWVSVDDVQPNDYNPNSVAKVEMGLLYTSIKHDGYTQPIVTVIDNKCDIILLCGHKAHIESRDKELWKVISPLKKLLHTPQVSLTLMEQLPSYTVNFIKNAKAGIEYKLAKPTAITAGKSVSGSQKFGELAKSMTKQDYATSQSGMLRELTTLNSCLHIVCPICELKDKEQKNYWNTYLVEPPTDEGFGLLLSCLSSETSQPQVQGNYQNAYQEALTQLGQNVENSVLLDQIGTQENTLYVIDQSKAIIVDGFHRYFTCKNNPDIFEENDGKVPIVVLDKSINDRMASTVRHNRARGKHSIAGMSNIVFKMLDNGWEDSAICAELGMEPEELIKLKYITGFAKLFEDVEYQKAWTTKNQIKAKMELKNG